MAPRVSAEMKEALRLVFEEGLTAYAAAQRTGISQSAISQNWRYREFKEGKRNEPAAKPKK